MVKLDEMKQELQEHIEKYTRLREELLTFDDDIERVRLNDLLDWERGHKYVVKTSWLNSGQNKGVPVISATGKMIRGYTEGGILRGDEASPIAIACKRYPEKGVIIFDDVATSFRWIDEPIFFLHSWAKVLKPKKNSKYDFIAKYVYYAMRMVNSDKLSKCLNKAVPLPSIEKQNEIVAELDKMVDYEHYYDSGLPRIIELHEYAIKAKEERGCQKDE